MAYNWTKIHSEMMELIEDENVFSKVKLCALLGIDRGSFERRYKDTEFYEMIANKLRSNRAKLNSKIFQNILNNDNVTAQIFAWKVTAEIPELLRLGKENTTNTTNKKDNADTPPTINFILGGATNTPTEQNDTPQPKKQGKKGKK